MEELTEKSDLPEAPDDGQKRVALVTGAARGIGLAIASRLIAEGWRVGVADVDPAARRVAAELGDDALHVSVDVGDEPRARRAVHTVIAAWGRLDALVNNAALSAAHGAAPAELLLTEWDKVLRTNLTGPFLMAKHAIPFLETVGGCIVNIASTRAHQSEPCSEAYAATKGGLVSLTHALAASLAGKVRVNCVSPGWIHTGPLEDLRPEDHGWHWSGRVGCPDDVAGMVSWLLSPAAGFVSGQEFVLDGGVTRRMHYPE